VLRDRYDPVNLFALVPALGVAMDPVLAQLDQLLEDDMLFQAVRADLARRFPRTPTEGRPSTPVEVILRLLIVKHLYSWSYEETEHFVADSLVLRQFCRIYAERVPDDTTLLRWANLLQPETLHRLLEYVVLRARALRVTRGRKLRLDGTVVETNIHFPSDSTLLCDAVRVLSRTLARAEPTLSAAAVPPEAFRDRTRSAKRQMRRIMHAVRRRGDEAGRALRTAYRRLLAIAAASVRQAAQVRAALREHATPAGQRLRARLERLAPVVAQVVTQSVRRVLRGEAVPAGEKLVSLFEPHTAVVRKGKLSRPTEFGRVVWLDEVDGGLISRYAVLEGNPPEAAQLESSLQHHYSLFAHPPCLLAADRGVFSPANERAAQERGVKRVVLPKPGAKSAGRIAHERRPWFRRGCHWRAGIEGRISGLKRRHGLRRCLYHGGDGMERWVGWGILAHNLRTIARRCAA
jgi:IS5 family transposase